MRQDIDLIDLIARRRLAPVTLNYDGQLYLQCRWVDNVLRVLVEHSFQRDGARTRTIHKFVVAKSGSVREITLQ